MKAQDVQDKLNGEYEMDVSQRMDFCHWLLHFFENLIEYKNLL